MLAKEIRVILRALINGQRYEASKMIYRIYTVFPLNVA